MTRRTCFIFIALTYVSGCLLAACDFHKDQASATFMASTLTALQNLPRAAASAGTHRIHAADAGKLTATADAPRP